MAKISVSIPDDVADELRAEAVNVSRFVTGALRDALDRRRLEKALDALDQEFGAVGDGVLAEAEAEFAAVERSLALASEPDTTLTIEDPGRPGRQRAPRVSGARTRRNAPKD